MKNLCPCITKTRGSQLGFWVSNHKQRMGTKAMAKFQGIDLSKLNVQMLSAAQLGGMIGNAWSINVSAKLIKQVLVALGLIPNGTVDPWQP